MKKITSLLGLLAVGFTNAQESEYYGRVGINTETPQTTLDIVGRPTDPNAVDGILIPRITLNSLTKKQNYGSKERGTLVYVNEVKGNRSFNDKYITIMEDGFHYWDGERWLPFGTNKLNIKTEPSNSIISERRGESYFIEGGNGNQGILLSERELKISDEDAERVIGVMYINPKTNLLHIWNGKEWIQQKQ